ncbi:ATP-dependent helicase HepA [Pseudarthrobacter defluvii]|uniref:protein DpdE n=1 Tax=Pseudarthrobacter defluvii TaxID=410837 RepID=UPI002785FF96|nr:protein DpdE [Pseudarthrobacter defluvii]MDQ0770253.1 ATP-dependent helicase HepA [Pseudarthrobacter defluvii]
MTTDRLGIGQHVTFPGAPGIGRLTGLRADAATVEFFESVAEPSVGVRAVPRTSLRVVQLERETRVFFQDEDLQWRAGRIIAAATDSQDRAGYWVRLPNTFQDTLVLIACIRVRWDKKPRDPLQILLAGGNETPRFRDARQPVRALLLQDRASAASTTGIASAGVQMHSHQVAAAFRILRDPIQRYLLADEVGMGKTIEAGFVIRQTLIDDPKRKIGVIAPDSLIEQWRSELRDKFFIGDFGRRVAVVGHSDLSGWKRLMNVDLLVVDEAHLLANDGSPLDPTYAELNKLAKSAARLLLLSATPFTQESTTHLALLHLLDGDLFSWERQAEFEALLKARSELAYAVYQLDEEPDPENPEYLQYQLDGLRSQVPNDVLLDELVAEVMATFDFSPVSAELLKRRTAAVRAHVSETYRLHQRVIRNRRHNVLQQRLDDEGIMTPFSLTGRIKPRLVRLQSEEVDTAAGFVEEWLAKCSVHVLDNEMDSSKYGAVGGLLVSRLGGPLKDLAEIIQYRAGLLGPPISLSRNEMAILKAAPTLPFENDFAVLAEPTAIDAVDALAATIIGRSKPAQRVVVFCGHGTFAKDLVATLQESLRGRKSAFAHLASQSDEEREKSVHEWRRRGGVLVLDESGDVGRNLQDASLVVHARLPWSPNLLEQRIGRVDRYGRNATAQGLVVTDSNPHGILTAWARLLSRGFKVFERSISAEQEVVEELATTAWEVLVGEGIEKFESLAEETSASIAAETRRINELDALESSWELAEELGLLAENISRYDECHAGIATSFRTLLDEGFRFEERQWDGSLRFSIDDRQEPLISPRLATLLQVAENSRIGGFDRWRVSPGRRLFRRGNPFIDGLERVLELDDRGQASALWRIDRRWGGDALIYFAFDYQVEANPEPLMQLLGGERRHHATAMRRCDWALSPFERRIWIDTSSMAMVESRDELDFLNAPFAEPRDKNLNPARIRSLHNLVGTGNLSRVASAAAETARAELLRTTALREACAQASLRIAAETEVNVARSRARSAATRMVADPEALDFEIAIGRAVQRGVENPVVSNVAVTCLVRAAEGWEHFA